MSVAPEHFRVIILIFYESLALWSNADFNNGSDHISPNPPVA